MQREIERQPVVPALTGEAIALLSELCFRSDNPQMADIVFAFGTNVAPQTLANKIEYLLMQNLSARVIITGGIADYKDCKQVTLAESAVIYSYINSPKFPGVEFILEDASRNNLENVAHAARKIDFSHLSAIICLSHSYASARSVQTLKNVFNGIIYSVPYDVSSDVADMLVSRENWWQSERGRALVWGEYLRIKTYCSRGDFLLTDKMQQQLHTLNSLFF